MQVDTRAFIAIKGANMHNLKNVDVVLPKNKLIVITGVSGSGKSSLAIDTLYAEGQRRYVESLSAYVRQFMGRLQKPDVYSIEGITPAIAIQQKVSSTNPRSTVGTVTEIYDFLKLLYTRIGVTYSPISGEKVKRDTPETTLEALKKLKEGTKIYVFAPIRVDEKETLHDCFLRFHAQGYSRIKYKGEIVLLMDLIGQEIKDNISHIDLLVDRFSISLEEEHLNRMLDSLSTAFNEGEGNCKVEVVGENTVYTFNNTFSADGMQFQEPSLHFFSFNNPIGACERCEGFGNVIGLDPNLVILDEQLSINDGVVECWKGEKMSEWKERFVAWGKKSGFPVFRSYVELTEEEKQVLWDGNNEVEGITNFFDMVQANSYKIQYRVMLSRFRGKTICPSCKGGRLRKETNYVKIAGKSINELLILPVEELKDFFKDISLSPYEQQVAKRLLVEINSRIEFICKVGLGYLTLDRVSSSLSGGESQRINLATSLGSSLVGSTYILDEPSIGLHSRDSEQLIDVLEQLRDLGNTVLVVEHDEDIMRKADLIIDMGPYAGVLGGEIVAYASPKELVKVKESLTAQYLNGTLKIKVPSSRRTAAGIIKVTGAREHNLKKINVNIPLNSLVAVTGVSGSGKSTLVRNILYPALKNALNDPMGNSGLYDKLEGDINMLSAVEFIDQNPIGKSSRSNPATYVKVYDEIRDLYARLNISKMRGYKPAHFSFNTDGGRCDKCKGEGSITIEMQFMADVILPCDDCKGKRFKAEVLEVVFEQKSITDVLETTIDEVLVFFEQAKEKQSNSIFKKSIEKIIEKLVPLQRVGLGYVALGQSSSTLSGGEAQRIKLASFLGRTNATARQNVLFIFDEPTTGLHFYDIQKLLIAFDELIKRGHSVLLIEHHLDVIKCADYVIDLGPEAGKKGGNILYQGTPEGLVKCAESYTGQYLKEKLKP
jgi:excinuclease ABC subunit A